MVIIMTFISIQNLKYCSIPGFEKLTVITPYILASVMFLSELLLWSFIEYMLHRYLFHLDPPDDSWFWMTFHFFLLGQHHMVCSYFIICATRLSSDVKDCTFGHWLDVSGLVVGTLTSIISFLRLPGMWCL